MIVFGLFSFYEPLDIQSAQVFINKDDKLRQYFGDSNGKVYMLWEGTTDNGLPIEMEWESLLYQIGDPTVPFEIDEIGWRMNGDAASPITIECSADNRDWVRVAEAQKVVGKSPKIHNVIAQAMDIRFRIHEYSPYKGAEVYQIVLNGQLPEVSRMLPKNILLNYD